MELCHNNGKVQTPIDPKSGLPMLTMFHNIDDAAEKLEIAMYSCVAAENNQNLSPSQKEMLRWHFRLGHASMSAMHWLARRGLLGKLSERLLRVNETPLCATCQYGKQVRRPTGTTGSSTYAPVVKWATIRSVLAFAIKHDLCSRQGEKT